VGGKLPAGFKGHVYSGKVHSHWSRRCWHRSLGCIVFRDPGLNLWYYWCPTDNCYYPVSYCPYNTYRFDGDEFSTNPGNLEEIDN
jgi:hypothetical protein